MNETIAYEFKDIYGSTHRVYIGKSNVKFTLVKDISDKITNYIIEVDFQEVEVDEVTYNICKSKLGNE